MVVRDMYFFGRRHQSTDGLEKLENYMETPRPLDCARSDSKPGTINAADE